MDLQRALEQDKTLRVIGFDDAPFHLDPGDRVDVAGIVCAATRFEGMHWFTVERDGFDSTEAVIQTLHQSKFLPQLHALLFDGVAFGGFNILDLPRIEAACDRPVIAVMRKEPDMDAVERALQNLSETPRRIELLARAGDIHNDDPYVFQCHGCDPTQAAEVLRRCTDNGHVPEALRLAHLIGAAIKQGTSSNRA